MSDIPAQMVKVKQKDGEGKENVEFFQLLI